MLNPQTASDPKKLIAIRLDEAAIIDPSSELTKAHLEALMLLNTPSSTR